MPQITTTEVAESLDDLHRTRWHIVARRGCMSDSWAWTIGMDADLFAKGCNRGTYTSAQRREPDRSFVLLGKVAAAPVARKRG